MHLYGGRIQIGYDKKDEPSLDDLTRKLLELTPELEALLDKKSEDELLSLSTALIELSHRDPADYDDRPGRARQLLEIVVTRYRVKAGQI